MIYKRRYKNTTYFLPKHPEKIFQAHIGVIEEKLSNFIKIIDELSDLCKKFPLPEKLSNLEQLEPIKNTSD